MVNSVSFASAQEVFKPLTQEDINAPHKSTGVYAQPQSDAVELSSDKAKKPKKKNKFWRTVGWLAGIAAVVLGGSYLAKRGGLLASEKAIPKFINGIAEFTERNAVNLGKWAKGIFVKNIDKVPEEAPKRTIIPKKVQTAKDKIRQFLEQK